MRDISIRSLAILFAFVAGASVAAPYDDRADAKGAIRAAQQQAIKGERKLLLIFGANWCEDCRALDTAMKAGRNAALIAREFEVVKIDVGKFDRNLDIAAVYGNPIKKGIPAAVILSAKSEVLYATRAGELANARRMSESGIYEFFVAAAKR